MKKWLIQWLMGKELREREVYAREVTVDEAVAKPQPKIRIGQMEVMNGKLLEIATYKANPHGPDWKTEYYILEDGVPLADQLATVMVMKGMSV